MSKIKIKNFGPIKEGFKEDDGWFDIKKVTVFIGNQGSGKSTIAKIISTFLWIEKEINLGEISTDISVKDFQNYFNYFGIKAYLKSNSIIQFIGNYWKILYDNDAVTIEKVSEIKFTPNAQIIYVPAERNFLNVIKDATKVRGLPLPLDDFSAHYKNSQLQTLGDTIKLPIENINYRYDVKTDNSFVFGNDYEINLLNASSGIQSLIPLYMVIKYLNNEIKDNLKNNQYSIRLSNVSLSLKRDAEFEEVTNDLNLSTEEKEEKLKIIASKYSKNRLISIVEEPEQNLFPSSQKHILHSLLEFVNDIEGNELIITTHSPYIINYLTLCIKAGKVYQSLLKHGKKVYDNEPLETHKIVPKQSTIKSEDLAIYELNEIEGTIQKLSKYSGLPSDDNFLNNCLEDSNELFAQLQEIEKGWR